jgi:hypothetical protein
MQWAADLAAPCILKTQSLFTIFVSVLKMPVSAIYCVAKPAKATSLGLFLRLVAH